MKTNYQFSFNPTLKEIDNKQEANITTFLKDIFPYLSTQSVTFCLLIIQALFFLLSIHTFTITPNQKNTQKNIFIELATNIIYSIVVGRMGSQYQVKLGRKYYLTIVIVMQLARFSLVLVLRLDESLFMVNSPTLLSLYILSLINIKKWKENEAALYGQQQKIVENYDLLDLNDTVIKLKTNQNTFMYQSYTNRQFYYHNFSQKEQKIHKNSNKHSKKNKNSTKFIESGDSQDQNNSLNLFKCVIYHFIVFSNYQLGQFFVLLITQTIIYLLMSSQLIKRINFT